MDPIGIAEVKKTLEILAGDERTVGRYTQLAWSEGLLVTGSLIDGAMLDAHDDKYAAEDQTPATLTADLPLGIPSAWDSRIRGIRFDEYKPVLAAVNDKGEPQIIVWAHEPKPIR